MNVRVIPHKPTFTPLAKRLGRMQAQEQYKGPWAVEYRCPVTKKRKYESFATKKEAIAKKKEFEGDDSKGTYTPLHKRTWTEFVKQFRETMLANVAHKTKLAYDETIAHFERLCSPTIVSAITTATIDKFAALRTSDTRGKFKKRPIRKHTINKGLVHLRAMLRKAHRWDYLPKLPEFRMLRAPDPDPRAISLQEFDAILDSARSLDAQLADRGSDRSDAHDPPCSAWWVAFLSVGYLAGIRWNEILNLRWANLQFTAKPELRVWNKKAGRWDRVPMRAELVERLQAWMNSQESQQIQDTALVFPHVCHTDTLRKTWTRLQQFADIERLKQKLLDADLPVVGVTGGPSPKSVAIHYEDDATAVQIAGSEKINKEFRWSRPYRFHDLRVSFCTNLVAAGVEAPTLMKLARHRSIATTMKYYRGRTDDADRRALERMFAAVESGASGRE
jgi:integrase